MNQAHIVTTEQSQLPVVSQDNMCYMHCYKCNTQKWYYLDSNECDVHIDAVQCSCGEWLQ